LEWAPESGKDRRMFCLEEVLDASENIRVWVETDLDVLGGGYYARPAYERQTPYDESRETLELLHISGLNALSRKNPMELYTAAVNRSPSNILDSVYGIMQVFGFRLGQSNPHSKPDSVYTLLELEDELGLALMEFSPVLSQNFKHVAWPRDRGKNWRISRQSTIPEHAFTGIMPWDPEIYTSVCELGTQQLGGGLWGRFRGKCCSFSSLKNAWANFDTRELKAPPTWMDGESDMCIVLDVAPDLFSFELATYDARRGPLQYSLASQLVDWECSQLSQPDDFKVLHLGFHELAPSIKRHFALILLRSYEDAAPIWRRLGICTWDVCAQPPDPGIISWSGSRIGDRRPAAEYGNYDPFALEEEDLDEYRESLTFYWKDLSIQSSAWQEMSGVFG